MAAGHFTGSAISPMLVNGIGIYGSCIAGGTLQVLSMLVEPFNAYMGTITPLYGACAIVFCYFWYVEMICFRMCLFVCCVCLLVFMFLITFFWKSSRFVDPSHPSNLETKKLK